MITSNAALGGRPSRNRASDANSEIAQTHVNCAVAHAHELCRRTIARITRSATGENAFSCGQGDRQIRASGRRRYGGGHGGDGGGHGGDGGGHGRSRRRICRWSRPV